MAVVGVGQQGLPSLAPQTPIQDINTLGNDAFNQGNYREAIMQYNIALGESHLDDTDLDHFPNDPLILWNRSAAYVLLGKYRTS
jgi:hypothetical protein